MFEVECDGYAEVNATYDLGYASGNTEQAAPQQDQILTGAGGYWDSSGLHLGPVHLDSPVVSDARISIDGTDVNIGFLFYSNRAQDNPTRFRVNLLYIPGAWCDRAHEDH